MPLTWELAWRLREKRGYILPYSADTTYESPRLGEIAQEMGKLDIEIHKLQIRMNALDTEIKENAEKAKTTANPS